MLIQCSSCNSKYLVNSADLKPNGRMVECANCTHQWYQDLNIDADLEITSILNTEENEKKEKNNKESKTKNINDIKNLPSTFVKEKKVSVLNSLLVILLIILIFLSFWFLRKYGANLFVLINFYINEFFFNLKLIISDISKIIYQIMN
tara:strand:+ start:19 stop:462 length:444 start_codon:yes stop_codon:yes gene_type:complete